MYTVNRGLLRPHNFRILMIVWDMGWIFQHAAAFLRKRHLGENRDRGKEFLMIFSPILSIGTC